MYKSGEQPEANDLISWINKSIFPDCIGQHAIVSRVDKYLNSNSSFRIFVIWVDGAPSKNIALFSTDFELVKRNAGKLIQWL